MLYINVKFTFSIFQMIEVCLISVITSAISFGLPLFRKCTPCPEADVNSGIECPRPPGMYGNYVNVSDYTSLSFFTFHLYSHSDFICSIPVPAVYIQHSHLAIALSACTTSYCTISLHMLLYSALLNEIKLNKK